MGRKKAIRTRWRVLAAIVLVALAGAGYLAWQFVHWTPSRKEFPVQGVLVGARYGPANFVSLNMERWKLRTIKSSLAVRGFL